MRKQIEINRQRFFFLFLIFVYVLFLSTGIILQSQKLLIISLALAFLPVIIFLIIFKLNIAAYFTILIIPLSIKTYIGNGVAASIPSEAIVLVLAIVYLFFSINKTTLSKHKVLSHPVSILIILDLIWSLISGVLGEMPFVSIKRLLLKTAFIIVFYFLFVRILRNKKNLVRVWVLYSIGLLIPVFWTLFNHSQYGFSKVVSFAMPLPFYNDHTLYAACITFILPILVTLAIKPNLFGYNKKLRFAFAAVALLFIIGIIFSFSRAAWLSIIVSGIAGLLIVLFRFKAWHFLTFVVLALLILSYFRTDIYQRIEKVEDVSRQTNVEEHIRSSMNIQTDVSNLERINRWKCALRMFEDKPIAGFGPGTYQFVYGKYQVIPIKYQDG